MTVTNEVGARSAKKEGFVLGLNHISIHVRDVDEAMAFWVDLFGAEHYRDFPGQRLFNVELAGVVLAFFDFEGRGMIGRTVEYPHYAFTVTSDGIRTLKQRLDEAGVKTHDLWTRTRTEALLYFRDPSGNLFELFCPNYDRPDELRVARGRGGDYRPPLEDLMYDWPKA